MGYLARSTTSTRPTQHLGRPSTWQSDDEGALGSDDEGSEFHHNRDDEGEQANTHVPSTPQQEKPQPSTKGSMLPKNSEAADFSSDTSPRNETGDNEELSRAERK